MLRRIIRFFRHLDDKITRSSINFETLNMRTSFMASELKIIQQRQHEWFLKLQASQAEANKRLSSIEMEMLLARGASLDNNFDGKTEL